MTDRIAALFGFALMTAYWPNISGVATTPRWDVGALLGLALFFTPRVRMTATHWLGLSLLAWLFVSLFWSAGWLDGVDAAFTLTVAAVAFALGCTMTDMRAVFMGAAIGLGISSAVVIAQWFGWQGLEQYDGGPGGLFYNRDRLAAAAALVAIGTVALRVRPWLLLPLLAPSLVLTHSRGAWLALAAGLLSFRPNWSISMWPLRIIALVAVIAIFAVRGFNGGGRMEMWQDTLGAIEFHGHGLGSFRETYPGIAHAFDISHQNARPEHPHNEWLWLAYEGGIVAFALALTFAYRLFRESEDEPERGILAGLFVLSLFAMPLHDPATVILGALCAGRVAGRAAGVRDAAVDRRSALRERLAPYGPADWSH